MGTGYTVLYRGSAETYEDKNLSAGTKYYYYFFAENYKYYSAAETTDATTLTSATAPTGSSLTYNGSSQTGVASGTGYTLSGTTSATAAGNYSATATLKSGYIWSDGTTAAKTISWSIAKATLTVTAVDQTVTYGSAAPTYTATYSGFKGSDSAATVTITGTLTYTCSYTTTSGVGTYDITPVVTSLSATNYKFTAVKGTLTVNKADQAALTLTAATVTYSSKITLATYTSGGSSGETVTYTITGGTGTGSITSGKLGATKAGTFTVTATMPGGDNYNDVTSAPQTFTIRPKTAATPTLVANDSTTVTASWTASTEATAYWVQLSKNSGFSTVLQEVHVTGTSKEFTGLDPDTTYYVRIRAEDSSHAVYSSNWAKSEGVRTPASTTELTSSMVSVSPASYTYTGSAITPTVTVTDGGTTLTAGTHYTVSGSGTAVGSHTVTVTGIAAGGYSGSVEKTFSITAANISGATIASVASVTYNGSAHTPTPAVTFGGATLASGTDFTYSYSNNKNAGTATVTITGTGNFTGTKSTTFTISKATLTVTAADKSVTYGDAPPTYTVTYSGFQGSDTKSVISGTVTYTCSYARWSNQGTYTITPVVTSLSAENYTFTPANGTLTVGRKSLADSMLSLSQTEYTYDGTAHAPTLTVTDSGRTLVVDTDYTVSGTTTRTAASDSALTITVTGKGNYTGTASVTWRVNRSPTATEPTLTTPFTYDGTQKTALKNGSHVTLANHQKTDAGSYTATATPTGNYAWSDGTYAAKSYSWKINAKSIAGATVAVSPTVYVRTGSAIKPTPTVTLDGETLGSGNYTVSYANNTANGTATVTVTGKGNYTGTASTTFTIVESFASWIGASFIVADTGSGENWYKGSGGGSNPAFNGHAFGEIASLSLGGQAQTYGDSDGEANPVGMFYRFDGTGEWQGIPLHWFMYGAGNDQNHNGFGMGTLHDNRSGGTDHTGTDTVTSIDLSGLGSGSHDLEIYFQADYLGNGSAYDSNSSANYVATFSVANAIPGDTAVTGFGATADGNEMVRLAWTPNASYPMTLVLAKAGGAPNVSLLSGSYSVGDTLSDGSVVVALGNKGTAAVAVDHVVPAVEQTWHYAAVSYNAAGYAKAGAQTASAGTGTYESWEKLDTFSYTNGVEVASSGNGWKGGQGWGANYWGSSYTGDKPAADRPKWYARKPGEVPAAMVNDVVNYPASAGNVLSLENMPWDNSKKQEAVLNRVVESFGGSRGNTIYFAYRMAYAYSQAGQNRWAGIEFVSDVGGEKSVFVGKAAATDHQYHLGITATGASSPCWPNVGSGGAAYELKDLTDNANNAYVVVGKIDWTADNTATIYANAFYTGGDGLPENEPSWGSYGYSGATLGAINSIRFKAGADAGHGTIGYAYFDELRWGTSWEQLLAGKAPTDVWMDGQTTHVYTGDIVTNAITSTPKGAKQSAQSLLWTAANPNDTTWETYGIAAGFYTNKESDTQTEWHGVHQITQTAATTLYGLGAVTGNGVTKKSPEHVDDAYKKHTYTVRALPKPTLYVTAGDFKENLTWTRAKGYNETGSSSKGRTFNEVMVVRYSTSGASSLSGLKPVNGTAYYPGDVIYYNNDPAETRYMTVVYRGSDATSHVDAGLAKNTTYYYAAFTVNNSYYSTKSTVASAETTGTSTTPVVDGLTTDWVGGASPTKNSAAYSEEEFIWTDKALEGRKDTDACAFADIGEFRVKATASTVYFLLRLTNAPATGVKPTNTYVVVGVDTRTNSASTAMNWLGDESATFVGGGYYQTNAAIHYPERQMAVHYVGGSENTWQVEMYAENGAEWYAPQSGDWAAACSAGNSADPCIEWSVPRADLGLAGVCTGRFTVATFVNSGSWNNAGVGTVRIGNDSCAAVDAMEVVPYGVNDQDGKLGSWDEGLKNGNVNFWADVRFAAAGLDTHSAPTVPSAVTGPSGQGSPLLRWNASSDTDGFVTGYLLEVATNAAFGAAGDLLLYRVNVEGAATTSYQTRTSVSNFYWRVRARDSAGILSAGTAQAYTVTGKTDRDGPLAKLLYVGTNVMAFIENTDGYRDDQEKSGDATSVEDSDLQDGGHVFGFVIEWYDVNGVYATNVNRNTGGCAWNILAEHKDGTPYGRVSPNWDLLIVDRKTPKGTKPAAETVDGKTLAYTWKDGLELPTENGGTETVDCWYIDCGKDAVFTNDCGVTQIINDGNFGLYMTNFVTNAFSFGGYRDGVELYLTVSAEDGCMDTGDAGTSGDAGWYPWPSYSGDSAGSYGDDPRPTVNSTGFCKDGPHRARNVTTNQLLKFYVRDNDVQPPVASTNLWGEDATDASGAKFAPSLVVATSAVTKAQAAGAWASIPGKLAPVSGAGRDTVYQMTDQVIGRNLTFLFNVYDEYLHSGLQLGAAKTATVSGRTLTNTTAMVRTWDAETGEWVASDENYADYKRGLSTIWDINPTSGAEAEGTSGTGPKTVLAWDFGTITEENIDSLFGVDSMDHILSYIGTNSAGATNLVQLHLRDRDNNREGDQADAELTFGRLMLTDDDATAPEVSGDALLGTGTNAVEFGTLIGWTYNAPGNSATNLGVATNMTSMTSNVLWGIYGSTKAQIKNTKWLQLTVPKETAVTLGSSPYFQFDIAGRQGTEWTADTLVFEQRVSAYGPTNFLLTVMEPAGLTRYPAVAGGEVQSGWTPDGNTQFEKFNGQYRFRMTGKDGGSASLTGPSVSTAGKQVARLAFRVGWYGAESEGTLTVACSGSTLGTFTAASFMVTNDSVVSLQTAAAGHWLDVEYDLPLNAADVASWTATGLVGGNGFVVRDAEVITQTGYGEEHRLVQFNMPKDPGESYTWAQTESHVSAIWSDPLTTSVEGGGVRRFRLYGWAATSSSATWGINDVRLCGISSAPKGFQVTDADLVSGGWTNVLEVVDGTPEGYDTVKSGISVTNGTAAHQTNAPAYTLRKPDGTAAKSGTYGLLGLTEAQYTAVQETSFASGWTFTGGAESYEYAKAREGTRVLRLPGGDGTAASATRAVAMAYGEIGEGNISGATISGTLSLRALSTEAGMDNTVAVTLALLDGSGNEIVSKTETLPSPHMARWDEMRLEPLSLDGKTVRQARITIAQANAAGSEVYVDDLDLTLTLWGAEADMAGKTAAQVRAYNGRPGVKLRLATEALSSAAATMPLSSEIASGNTLYTLESTVYDADADRSNDGLPVTVASQFALYDDDDVAPQTGSMFGGGPLGVSIGGTLVPGASRSGSGTNLEWSVTDDALAKAGYAGTVQLGLNVYDYSGWDTASLALGSDAIQTGSTTASGYSRTASAGTANLPSATNEWTTTAGTLWNKYKGDFDTATPAKRTVTAILRDRDAHRANDDLAVTTQVARIWFIDQDVGDQAWASKDAGYQYMVISTNVPGATTAMRNVITNANPVSPNTVVNPYALGGSAAAHKTGLPDTRSFTIYDGDLRKVASDNLFVVTANIYDRAGSGKGRSATGLRRTSTETTSKTASVTRWNNTAGKETFTITNSYVAFETATAGTVGAEEVLSRVTISGNLSGSQANTKISTGNGHTSWAWSSFSAADVGTLLPEEYGTALNPSRDLYLNIHAYDIDTNRPNDQITTWLAGPRITVRDDDTTPPNAPASVWVNEEPVASGTIDRDTAPWQKSLSSVKVEWTEALDPEPAGFGTVGNDIKVAGIAGYWLADPGATPGVGDATALTDTTTNATTHKVSKTLTGLTILQGCGNYQLYAMDKDADRPGDALAGAAANVPLALDFTKPTAVRLKGTGTGASTDAVDDPTTQMDITWVNAASVGPDDPEGDKDNYDKIPDAVKADAAAKGRAATDILSPWLTYKVYYREYDPQEVEAAATGGQSPADVIYNDYIDDDSFGTEAAGWLAVTNDAPIADPSAGKSKYDTLGTMGTSSVRVYDLDFDREYLFVVVGVDKAGNEGPANALSWATNNTIKFAVTQGLVRASADINTAVGALVSGKATNTVGMAKITGDKAPAKGAVLYWMAAGMKDGVGEVKKYYDLIYRDAASFDETGTEEWGMASTEANTGTSKTNWNYQADAGLGTPGRMRFYRASYAGRWQGSYPLASEEVYSMNNVVLSEGYNYVSLQGVPYTNTFAGVFGTDTGMWPGASTASDTNNATRIEFYQPGTNAIVSEWYFFGADGKWYTSTGANVTDTLQSDGFFAKPFGIVLPDYDGENPDNWWVVGHGSHADYDGAKASSSKSVKAMMWHPILQVPTNGPAAGKFTQPVNGTSNYYNLLSLNLPVAVHPARLGLVATNADGKAVSGKMHASDAPWDADKLYSIDPATKEVRGGSMMYCDTNGKWRWVKNQLEVTGAEIKPNDMLVLVSSGQAPASWTWEYTPAQFYKLPDRHMGRKAPAPTP